ncbi:MAG TPA: hypothetical protein K8V15_05125 [Tessaracoccus flavescens]|uniref:Uncharacterized protein n=1 Tax=Tessaracoccus flavescens TaxID=399497 RepID=A0A921EMK6_9ACTN|nr:hypothetical protein [Tessaracoccus flavescens]
MSNNGDGGHQAPLAAHHPLRDDDPVKVNSFWLDSRLTASPAGTVYSAHEDDGDSVMLMLLSAGAAADSAARARFAGEINSMHIDTVVARGGEGQSDGLMGVRYRDDDHPELPQLAAHAPWAALAFDGSLRAVEEADRVLTAVDLSRTPPLSEPAGPAYKLHWINDTAPGTTRSWPLGWPHRTDRAGWITVLVSFLLMILLTALALLLAILLFQNQPLVNAPQPIPSPASGSGSGSGEPQSGSPSESGSQSGSPIESPGDGGGPYSHSPSMNVPDGDESGPGAPSPNRRL